MTEFNITLKSPTGEQTTITCPDDTYILDAAEEQVWTLTTLAVLALALAVLGVWSQVL